MFLHERIQQKLDEKNLKQADIARATGKSSAAVTKWLRGENVPKTEALKQIAKLLNVDDEWLLTGKGSSSAMPHLTPVATWDDETPLDEMRLKFLSLKIFHLHADLALSTNISLTKNVNCVCLKQLLETFLFQKKTL